MKFKGFLLNAYLGRLDRQPIDSYRDFEHSEKSLAIIENFKSLVKDFPPALLDQQGTIPPAAMQRLKTIGFFGLNIPEKYGGKGLDLYQYLKMVEEMVSENMSLGFTALAHLSIGIKGILLFGTEAQKRKYLVPAASGDMIFSYALTEPKTGSDAKNIQTLATLADDGTHYLLNGQKTYITNANYADALTVFAQLDPENPGDMGAFIVETGWEGITIGKDMPKMGLKASSTAAIRFKNVRVPKDNLIGRPGDGFKIAMTVLNYGRLALGAGSCGMMRQSLADMTQRAASRIQFGQPIGQFELIQEKLVRAKVNAAATSAITAFAAGMLEKDPLATVAIESSHCKLFGTTRAWDTLYDALQTAGGAGYLTTQPYEKRMRDFRVTTIFEGTTEIHSIYPALFFIRKLLKRLKTVSASKPAQIWFLLKSLVERPRNRLRFDTPAMNRALKVVRSNSWRIHLMTMAALLFYGKKIAAKEFLLRRISHLSLHMLGILALLARIESYRRAGRNADEDLELLGYFVEIAKKSRRMEGGLLPTAAEKLHAKIFRRIFTEKTRDRASEPASHQDLKN